MLGNKIKNIRIENKLTQEDFGKALHHTKSTVSKWENGKLTPDLETIKRMTVLFDVKMDDLLKDISTSKDSQNNKEKLLFEWKKVNYTGIGEVVKKSTKMILFKYASLLIALLGTIGLFFSIWSVATNGTQSNIDKTLHVYLPLSFATMIAGGIAFTVYLRMKTAAVIGTRYNIETKVYGKKIVMKSLLSGNSKEIHLIDIVDVASKSFNQSYQVEIMLENHHKIIFFDVDKSVSTTLGRFRNNKGEKND